MSVVLPLSLMLCKACCVCVCLSWWIEITRRSTLVSVSSVCLWWTGPRWPLLLSGATPLIYVCVRYVCVRHQCVCVCVFISSSSFLSSVHNNLHILCLISSYPLIFSFLLIFFSSCLISPHFVSFCPLIVSSYCTYSPFLFFPLHSSHLTYSCLMNVFHPRLILSHFFSFSISVFLFFLLLSPIFFKLCNPFAGFPS